MRGPGVVTGRYGTIGQAFYIEEDFWPLNTTLYVTSFNGNFPKFVKHVIELLPLASELRRNLPSRESIGTIFIRCVYRQPPVYWQEGDRRRRSNTRPAFKR